MTAGVLGTAAGVFAGTNVDDMLVLAVLNATARTAGRPRRWQIWVGQYTGIAVLTGLALLAAYGLTVLPTRWIGLLGVIPLMLGLYKLATAVRAHRDGEHATPAVATGLPGVIGLTIANGGDNIAAYTPSSAP